MAARSTFPRSDAIRASGFVLAAVGALVVFAATVAVQRTRYLNLDVAWYAYAATHVDLGACRLYVDCFVDTNPPFVLWLFGASVRAGALASLDPVASIRFAVAALALVADALLYTVLHAVLRQAALALALAAGYLAIVGFASLGDYGQREHLIALLIAPYVASLPLAGERRGQVLPAALTTGAFAGLAVAIKPYYALVPLACELWVAWRARSPRPLLRAQALALAATVAASAVALVLWAPGYLSLVPAIASAYPAYQEGLPALLQLDRITVALLLVPAVAWIAARAPAQCAPVPPLVVAALASGAVYFYQRTGYSYQGIPALALALFAAFCASLCLFAAGRARRGTALLASLCVLAMLVPVGGRLIARHGAAALAMLDTAAPSASGDASARAVATGTDETAWMIAAIRRHAGSGPVGYLSTGIDPLFPALLYTDATLANRMPHLWLIPALVRNGRAPLDATTGAQLRRRLVDTLREDLTLRPPRLLIEVRGRVQGIAAADFSPVRFLSAEPELQPILATYREVERMRRGAREVALYVADAPMHAAACKLRSSNRGEGSDGVGRP